MRFTILLLLFLSVYPAGAQTFYLLANQRPAPAPLVYADISLGGGIYTTGIVAINAIINNNTVVSLSLAGSTRPAPQKPADYQSGLFETPPQQSVTTLGILAGEVLHCSNPRKRLLLQGGLCGGVVRTAFGFQRQSPQLFGANYSYSTDNRFIMGLVLNPRFEFPTRTGFGVSAGGYFQANYLTAVAALQVGLMFGRVRYRIHRHPGPTAP